MANNNNVMIVPGEKVFIKTPGVYGPPWPARLVSNVVLLDGLRKVAVMYYGKSKEDSSDIVLVDNVFSYNEYKDTYRNTKKFKSFQKALKEMEADISATEMDYNDSDVLVNDDVDDEVLVDFEQPTTKETEIIVDNDRQYLYFEFNGMVHQVDLLKNEPCFFKNVKCKLRDAWICQMIKYAKNVIKVMLEDNNTLFNSSNIDFYVTKVLDEYAATLMADMNNHCMIYRKRATLSDGYVEFLEKKRKLPQIRRDIDTSLNFYKGINHEVLIDNLKKLIELDPGGLYIGEELTNNYPDLVTILENIIRDIPYISEALKEVTKLKEIISLVEGILKSIELFQRKKME